MAFARPKKREPVGEAGLFDYAVGVLARRMRTVRDLRRLMKNRAEEGEEGERAMDAVVARLKELKYLILADHDFGVMTSKTAALRALDGIIVVFIGVLVLSLAGVPTKRS